jgi:hypothetical protein
MIRDDHNISRVFLDTLMFPVSPWTLRAPDQLVRYFRPSVWLVLCGRTVSCEKNLCARKEIHSTDVFQTDFFKG